eukprot:1645478-Amphidinium_carterae.1
MEMEYHGSWWTGIMHEDYRTKTYDLNQHHFIEELDSDTEVFVDAVTEEGCEFCFQYTKKTDPAFALEPTKRNPNGRKWHHLAELHMFFMLKGPDLDAAKKIQVNLAVGHREGRMFRDKVYADGKVHKLVPIGGIIDNLGLASTDNTACLSLLQAQHPTFRTRHISVRGEWLRPWQQQKMSLTYVPSSLQIADALTKGMLISKDVRRQLRLIRLD